MSAQPQRMETIVNLESFLGADEAYVKGDLRSRLELVTALFKAKRISSEQRKWAHTRALLAHARAAGPDGDLPALLGWLGSVARDHKGELAVALDRSGALDEMVLVFGTRRLYQDPAFAAGDLPAKMQRIKELWKEREIDQGVAYSLTNNLVYRYLAPAGDDIDEALALFGELYRRDAMVWDSTGSIHRALLVRALHEKKELDSLEKKLAFVNEVTRQKQGDLAWMIVGSWRVSLLCEALEGDTVFLALDAAGRAAHFGALVKQGLLQSSDVRSLQAAYGEAN